MDFFLEYQQRFNWLIDVHWINLAYALAYKNFDIVKIQVDAIGINNVERQRLDFIANEPFDEILWKDLVKTQVFHKMNWRKLYLKEIDNTDTFFGFINSHLNQ